MPLATVLCFASLDGTGTEARGFRSWETAPAGWFRFSGVAGNYTLLFTQPAYFMRPVILNNVFTRPGEKLVGLPVSPAFDFFCFHEKEWDTKPARAYYQLFTAKGRSLTQVGFKLATDGVDGFGPKSQNLVVSIHRHGPGAPSTWEQVGPEAAVLDVDCGGAKNYTWSAGWNSGEVPLQPGETYAVQLRAEIPGNSFQAFWRKTDQRGLGCYRLDSEGGGFAGRQIWLGVSTDADGLLIPYNKRIHKQFGAFAGFAHKWSQTYVARGASLAGVVLYAAVGGAQPPLSRQRVAVRLRRGGPDGTLVGIQKIAIGNGNYTGDASWGTFGAAFSPGEAPVMAGETYAVEFESIENYETLHGFINIKHQVSDDRAGFNPYRKHARETYDGGTSFKSGTERQDFDLDMQIIEYEEKATNWTHAVDARNWVRNGGMDAGEADDDAAPASAALKENAQPAKGDIEGWKTFSLISETKLAHVADEADKGNRFARVLGAVKKKPADGGFVQRVEGLSRFETYRLSSRVRCSWAADFEHQASVGYDPTGQASDPAAASIVWTALPERHGVWAPYQSDPVRPVTNSISVWLRGRSTAADDFPFKADFDDVALRRVKREVAKRGE